MAKRAAPHRGIDTDPGDRTEPSKTELKAQSQALQELGQALSELSDDRLARTDMPDNLREAIQTWKRTRSHEGRRRQMQYVGKLMRNADEAPLREAVAEAKLGSARDTLRLHEMEHWRDALIADDEALTRWMAAHPDCDSQRLRSLVRAARKDSAAATPEHRQTKNYRELFQFIKTNLLEDSDEHA